jgi:hypothetical protein
MRLAIRRALLPVFVLLVFTAAAFAAAAIDGKWSGKLNGPDGEVELVLDLKAADEVLTGTATFPMFPSLEISNGKVTATEVSFDLIFGQEFTLPFRGRLDGESLKLAITGPMGTDSISFVRLPGN